MEGSVQTEKALLEEVGMLKARVIELERVAIERYDMYMHEQDARLKLEAALKIRREREACFMRLFESNIIGIVIADLDGRILEANEAFLSMLGYSVEELLNGRIHWDHITPEVYRWRDERAINALKTRGVCDPFEKAYLHKDGYEVPVLLAGAMLEWAHNQCISYILDLTERKALERNVQQAVVKAEARTEELSEALRALLVMAEVLVQGSELEAHREEEKVNGSSVTNSVVRVVQRLVRVSRQVLRCKHVSVTLVDEDERMHPIVLTGATKEEREIWRSYLEGAFLSNHLDAEVLATLQEGKSHKLTVPQHEGTCSCLSYLVVPMRIHNRFVGLLTVDYGEGEHTYTGEEVAMAEAVARLTMLVLERERLLQERAEAHGKELALMQANQRMDEFLSIASHELRTPMTTISGNIQLARRRLKALSTEDTAEGFATQLDQVFELLNRAERQVRTQNRLVSDLLDVSRIQADRLDLHKSTFDLTELVREVVEDQRTIEPGRVIELGSVDDLSIPVNADSDRISQVLTNYLTNALKYSPAHMPVAVDVAIKDQVCYVAVRDHGPGLTMPEQDMLWQRFYRVPGVKVQTGNEVGLGIGLHICLTIIERHGGRVGVESERGKGSTFWFTLPLEQVSEVPPTM